MYIQVVPAEYAFVLHTANPVTGQTGELFGEVVVGMGEALVGNQPGRALSFSAASNGSSPEVSLLSLPSKRAGLFSPSGLSNVIFRSDSNGEDLEAFAGAGKRSQSLRPIKSYPTLPDAKCSLFPQLSHTYIHQYSCASCYLQTETCRVKGRWQEC